MEDRGKERAANRELRAGLVVVDDRRAARWSPGASAGRRRPPTRPNCGATASRATTAGSARRGSRSKTSTSRTRRPAPMRGRRSSRSFAAAACRPRSRRVRTKRPTTASRHGSRGRSIRAAAARPNPARPQLHRMNRAEYRNAVRDLLALDVDVSALPADDSTYGFDNIADALGTSPLLLESYVTMARKISRMAIGSTGIPPVTTTYTTPEDLTQDYHLRDLPLGTRGGLRVEQYFAVDAEYEIRVRLRRTATGSIRGIAEEHQLELMLDGQRIGLFPVGGKDAYRPVVVNEQNPAQTASKAFTADEPMRVRMKIPAGRHTVVAAFVGKPAGAVRAAQQTVPPQLRVGEPSNRTARRRSAADHRPIRSGAADRHAQPRANLQLPSRDTRRGEPLRPLDPVAARPPRVSPAPRRIRARSAARVLRRREAAQRLRRRHRARAAVHADQPAVHLPARIRAGRSGARRGLRALGSGSWPRGSRSSCGAASRTMRCSRRPSAASSGIPRRSSDRCGGCWPTRAPRRWSRTSRGSGSTCATSPAPGPIRRRSPTSTTTCGSRSGARPSCSSRASCRKTAASSTC